MWNMSDEAHSAFQRFGAMKKLSYCTLLPSPEMLDISYRSVGSDMTDTLGDVKLIIDWLTREGVLKLDWSFCEKLDKQLNSDDFLEFLVRAFFGPFFPERTEKLVFWYYTGHGLSKDIASTLEYSSVPSFHKAFAGRVDDYVNWEDQQVKGGELCLHWLGFCGLYGLLKSWINQFMIQGEKAKGKDLVIVLDSCHSGRLAEMLKDFEELLRKTDGSPLNDNSITIQAACGPDESTFGGIFTPCFVYLNDPQNEELLNELKDEWENMTEGEKNEYRSFDLPSPMVVTTRASPESAAMKARPQGTTMEVNPQGSAVEANFKLTLFPDAGFFKFCSIKVFQDQQAKALQSVKERALTSATADAFMKSGSFTVLDYKLKPFKGTGPADPNAGSPMGLFLLDDPHNPGFAVCAHLHFKRGSTDVSDILRINLVHHKTPPLGSTLYTQDGGKVMVNMTTAAEIADAVKLVEACRHYVETNEPGRWNDVSRWNMRGNQLGVKGLIRLKERSAWEESYLKYIEQFNLPKVPK